MYIPKQKFDTIRIAVLRDITKIWKKINHIKHDMNIYFIESEFRKVIKKSEKLSNKKTFCLCFKWIRWFFKIHVNSVNFSKFLNFASSVRKQSHLLKNGTFGSQVRQKCKF